MWRYELVPMRLPRHDDPEARATEAALNVLDGAGWEAVTVVPDAGGWCWVLLKNPIKSGRIDRRPEARRDTVGP